jgi:DNA mismatch endonuclease (patch repair protein)
MISPHRERMQAVGRRDTDLELPLRTALWHRGLRYRVNRRIMGTRPDIVFLGDKVAVFVDGCFWHGCPTHYRAPVSNAEFWRAKVERNRQRDARDDQTLSAAGWRVVRVWGCQIKDDLTTVVKEIQLALERAAL